MKKEEIIRQNDQLGTVQDNAKLRIIDKWDGNFQNLFTFVD